MATGRKLLMLGAGFTTKPIDYHDMLKNYKPRLDIVSLVYNLNGGEFPAHPGSEECGMEVVRWLEKQDAALYSHVRFIIHTWNLMAGVKMARRLRSKGYRVVRIPFGS